MVSIEEAGIMLDEIADNIPQEIFRKLNYGIILLPEAKLHPKDEGNDLYTLGEYHVNGLGRYIILYYGSFERIYNHLSSELFKEELKHTLYHELTHHMESLAGERDLEITDAENLERYRLGKSLSKLKS